MFTAIMAAVVCLCVSGKCRSFFVLLCLYSMFIKFDTSFHIMLCKSWYVLKAWNKIIMIYTVVKLMAEPNNIIKISTTNCRG